VERHKSAPKPVRRFLLLPPQFLSDPLDFCLCRLMRSLNSLEREAGALDHLVPDRLR